MTIHLNDISGPLGSFWCRDTASSGPKPRSLLHVCSSVINQHSTGIDRTCGPSMIILVPSVCPPNEVCTKMSCYILRPTQSVLQDDHLIQVFLFNPISPIPRTVWRFRNSGISDITSRAKTGSSASLGLIHNQLKCLMPNCAAARARIQSTVDSNRRNLEVTSVKAAQRPVRSQPWPKAFADSRPWLKPCGCEDRCTS